MYLIHACVSKALTKDLLIPGFCTVYAFKTRKCPDGFNEARYLTFTNYTTCVVWLAFLPLFVLSTNNAIRAVTLSFLLNLSGTVQIFCLFVPKVYIALFKPSKNTKESIMCHHNRIGQPFCQSSTLSRSTGTLCCNGECFCSVSTARLSRSHVETILLCVLKSYALGFSSTERI